MINKLKALWELARVEHGIMLSFAVFVGLGFLHASLPLDKLCIALAVPFFIEVGAFALNDYIDYEVDKLNRRMDRPLVRGELKREEALWVSLAGFFIALALSFLLPEGAFLIALAFILLSLAYDVYLKKIPLLGNAVIALSMAIPFPFANALVGKEITGIIAVVSTMVFLAGLAREIIKDIEDLKGELKKGIRTLPAIIGIKRASQLAGILLILFMALGLIPFLIFLVPHIPSALLLVFAYGFIGYSAGVAIFQISNKRGYERLANRVRRYTLAGFALGLLSLYIATLGL